MGELLFTLFYGGILVVTGVATQLYFKHRLQAQISTSIDDDERLRLIDEALTHARELEEGRVEPQLALAMGAHLIGAKERG